MGRWKQLSKIKKAIIILLSIITIGNFTIGYDFGYNVEQERLKTLVSETLLISKDVIERIEIKNNNVDIYISTLQNTISTKDTSIFEYIEPEYVIDIKDKFNNREIYLH